MVRPAPPPERVRKPSPRYKVLLHNDPVNTMEFVVMTLRQVVPSLSEQDAIAVMLEGVAVDLIPARRDNRHTEEHWLYSHLQGGSLLTDPAPEETAHLGAIRFQPNRAVLHRDPSVMPRRRRCWWHCRPWWRGGQP